MRTCVGHDKFQQHEGEGVCLVEKEYFLVPGCSFHLFVCLLVRYFQPKMSELPKTNHYQVETFFTKLSTLGTKDYWH